MNEDMNLLRLNFQLVLPLWLSSSRGWGILIFGACSVKITSWQLKPWPIITQIQILVQIQVSSFSLVLVLGNLHQLLFLGEDSWAVPVRSLFLDAAQLCSQVLALCRWCVHTSQLCPPETPVPSLENSNCSFFYKRSDDSTGLFWCTVNCFR